MTSPTSRTEDVIKLLNIIASGGDAMQVLYETAVLNVFSCREAQKVLSALLQPDVMSKQPFQITMSLFKSIARHCPSDQTNRIIAFLLSPTQRKTVRVSLHKTLIRIMFEKSYYELLEAEWAARTSIHKDARFLIVQLCASQFADASATDEIMNFSYRVLKCTAEELIDINVPPYTALILFGLCVNMTSPNDDQFIADKTNSRSVAFKTFLDVKAAATAPLIKIACCSRWCSPLQELIHVLKRKSEDEFVQAWAEFHWFELSEFNQSYEGSNGELLVARLRDTVLKPRYPFDLPDRHLHDLISRHFAILVNLILEKVIQSNTGLQRKESLAEACKVHPVASIVRDFIQTLIQRLIDEPIRNVSIRAQDVISISKLQMHLSSDIFSHLNDNGLAMVLKRDFQQLQQFISRV